MIHSAPTKSTESSGALEGCWPHIDALIEAGGHVTVGRIEPFEGVAIAANATEVFAVLRRRPEERAAALLARLEAALSSAIHGGQPVNEIGPEFGLARPSVGSRSRRG